MVCLIDKKQWILKRIFFFSSAILPSIERTIDRSQSPLGWTEAKTPHSPREGRNLLRSPHKVPVFPHISPGFPPLGEADDKCISVKCSFKSKLIQTCLWGASKLFIRHLTASKLFIRHLTGHFMLLMSKRNNGDNNVLLLHWSVRGFHKEWFTVLTTCLTDWSIEWFQINWMKKSKI